MRTSRIALAVLVAALPLRAADPAAIRLPVTRDTWLSNVGDEARGSSGGAARLKLKSHQEMSLIDVDPAPLRGRVVLSAMLHVRSTGEPRLKRVSVSGVGAPWHEGTATNYAPQVGSSTFLHRRAPDQSWTTAGGDLCSVILSQGGTLWRSADASPPDTRGWQRIPVEPAVVASRLAGLSHGFLLFDDTGSEWTRQGERYTSHHFPNRYVFSREAGVDAAPYFTVTLGDEDRESPAAPGALRGEAADLPAGEAWITWATPADTGPAGTLGFLVSVDGTELPRYLVPLAGKAGEAVRLRLRDRNLTGGQSVRVAVRAVDAAGNIGTAAEVSVVVSDRVAPALPGSPPTVRREPGPLPRLGGAEVAVVDELDKIHPVSGKMIPEQAADYLAANHLWSAARREVHLHAARNEFVAFQVVLRGAAAGVQPSLTFDGLKATAAFGRYVHVPGPGGPLPDPIVPLRGPYSVPTPTEMVAGQRYGSLHAEVYVPHDAPVGDHEGTLMLRSDDGQLSLRVRLRVWHFTLPDMLSFLPEMNCYGLPDNESAYYRMAHRHRTVLNRLPYGQDGRVHDGCAPTWDGTQFRWDAWDRRFAPYLDGSAFADLPRRGIPLEVFYLPLHENWPTPMAGNYNGDYWADRAFPASYRAAFVSASKQYAEHLDRRGWNRTMFHGFLNNKNLYKERGWSRASSPWLLDEPSNFQDYWALRYFSAAFHEGVRQANGTASLLFRADISRPMWQRNVLDGLLDYNVVSSSFRDYRRMVLDRKAAHGEIVMEYGGTNAVADANVQAAGWCVDAWALGADGVLPWQTVGTTNSWTKADELSLFYPTRGEGDAAVVPSVRLKAYRRGQQDVEYLTLWQQLWKQPRWAAGRTVRQALRLEGKRTSTGFVGDEDAGVVHYARLRPQDLWRLRMQLAEALSEHKPLAKRRLVEWRTPPRDPAKLAPAIVTGTETLVATPGDTPAVSGRAFVVRGREVVRDALIDFDRPGEVLGRVGRENALRKAERSNAFLIWFDLERLNLPAGAKVTRAAVVVHVWDPSSQGRTKVVAYPVKTAWDEASATWNRAAEGRPWRGGATFRLEDDAGAGGTPTVFEPDRGDDIADPPLEYAVDVTAAVRDWLSGKAPNHGVALVPVADRSVDEGHYTRIQLYSREHGDGAYAPRLTVDVAR